MAAVYTPVLHKQHGKRKLIVCYYDHFHSEDTIFLDTSNSEFKEWGRFCHVVYPVGFALRATTQHDGKAGGLQILCCQGINVTDYNFNLDALL